MFPLHDNSMHREDPILEQEILNPDTNILRNSYNFDESIESTSLDILALYLKGQKVIYTESKTLCEKRLNTLMLPAIFISAVCAILNFILKEYSYGIIIISCFNAFNSFILSLISYLKLDAKAEAHKTSAYKYQKLESRCEFHSGKTMFFKNNIENRKQTLEKFVEEIQKDTIDIRESNQFIIPEIIRLRYPKIYSTNVFALVKEIQNDEIIIINRLKTSVQHLHNMIDRKNKLQKQLEWYEQSMQANESKLLGYNMEMNSNEEIKVKIQYMEDEIKDMDLAYKQTKQMLEETIRLVEQYDNEKNEAFNETVKHRSRYLKLSETFNGEMSEQYDRKITSYCNVCDWFKT